MQKSSLHIAIDGNEANVTNRVGSNLYAFEIIRELYALTEKTEIRVTVLLSHSKVSDLPVKRKGWNYRIVRPQKFWTQWALPLHLWGNRGVYDVFYTPGHYAPRFCPIPYVSSVMDLAFLRFPNLFKKEDTLKLTNWTHYSVKNAQKVITISEFTKSEIVELYGKNKKDIVVAPPAISAQKPIISLSEEKMVLDSFHIRKPFILFVGTLQPRKNIDTLISAFEQFVQTTKAEHARNAQLVIAGKIGWLADPILDQAKSSPVASQIICTDFITDQEKYALYQGATCSTLLGLYEGFGIPPLESLQMGTLPIVSNSSSLPEVVGEAGILIDPTDSRKIADAFSEVFSLTSKERGIYRRKAREQLKKFSWTTSAQIVLDTLQEVYTDQQ